MRAWTDSCLLVRADAVGLLPALPPACVDAVVTDPPWNRDKGYGSVGDVWSAQGYVDWLAWALRQGGRVSRGLVVAFLGQESRPHLSSLARDAGLEPPAVLEWERDRDVLEPVAVLAKPGHTGPSRHALRRAASALRSAPEPAPPERWGHPCPKPLAAVEGLVRLACPPGGTVLDPFAGTGTTLLAAQSQGCRGIGIELEAKFCRVAVRRLRQARCEEPLRSARDA